MTDRLRTVNERQGEPYLSVVATSRNDDHGEDLLARMQVFVSALVSQSMRHAVPSELVLVEWNPPPDRPPLRDALTWPDDHGWCPVRIITVPPALHDSFTYSDKLPLFQMIAKNAGIRRAQGQFVLATNIDILFSDPLMAFLAQRTLLRGCLYRSDRIDVDRGVPVRGTIEAQLTYCRTHVLRANRPDGIRFAPLDGSPHTVDDARLAQEDLPSRHGLGRSAPHLWLRKMLRRTAFGRCISRLPLWQIFKERQHGPASGDHDRLTLSFSEAVADPLWALRPLPDLHLSACGDFTLMARETWFGIGGNPELEMFSLHLDSLALYNAHAHGVREVRLSPDMVHYHIEHERGWTPEGGRALYERLQSRGIPYMTLGLLAKCAHCLCYGDSDYFSSLKWGLANHMLPETHISGGRIIQVPSLMEIQV